jgi:hypothetical protein
MDCSGGLRVPAGLPQEVILPAGSPPKSPLANPLPAGSGATGHAEQRSVQVTVLQHREPWRMIGGVGRRCRASPGLVHGHA